jgi:CRISPR-associated protein Csd1
VLPGLVGNSRSHLNRLYRTKKTVPAANALEVRLDEVLERINPFPGRFTVSEQGLFILGYHHQRAWDRRQREAASAAKRAREGAEPEDPDADTPDLGDS